MVNLRLKSIGSTFELIDAFHRPLGRILVEQRQDSLVVGRFIPGPAFSTIKHLFRRFEQAVNAQALSVVDELDAQIAALGLRLRRPGDVQETEIKDVQIWSDGNITFYLSENIPAQADVYRSLFERPIMASVPQP